MGGKGEGGWAATRRKALLCASSCVAVGGPALPLGTPPSLAPQGTRCRGKEEMEKTLDEKKALTPGRCGGERPSNTAPVTMTFRKPGSRVLTALEPSPPTRSPGCVGVVPTHPTLSSSLLSHRHPGPELVVPTPSQPLHAQFPPHPVTWSPPLPHLPRGSPPHPSSLRASVLSSGKSSLTFLTRSNPTQAHRALGASSWALWSHGQFWLFSDRLCPALGCRLWVWSVLCSVHAVAQEWCCPRAQKTLVGGGREESPFCGVSSALRKRKQ